MLTLNWLKCLQFPVSPQSFLINVQSCHGYLGNLQSDGKAVVGFVLIIITFWTVFIPPLHYLHPRMNTSRQNSDDGAILTRLLNNVGAMQCQILPLSKHLKTQQTATTKQKTTTTRNKQTKKRNWRLPGLTVWRAVDQCWQRFSAVLRPVKTGGSAPFRFKCLSSSFSSFDIWRISARRNLNYQNSSKSCRGTWFSFLCCFALSSGCIAYRFETNQMWTLDGQCIQYVQHGGMILSNNITVTSTPTPR